jgi:hypothetical protein
MAGNNLELLWKIKVDASQSQDALKQLRSELTQTAQTQKTINQGELSTHQQLAAVASLQRQRSAALIAEWKQQETAAKRAAEGTLSLSQHFTMLTGSMSRVEHSMASARAEMLVARNAVRVLGTEVGEVLPGHLGHAVSQMAYLDSTAGALGATMEVIATPVGAVVAGIAAIAVAGIGSIATLYEMASGANETANKLLNMSQKTGLSVETLQALDEASKVTGSSLENIVQSVGIFEKNLTKADSASSQLAKGFKKLGIDTSDANKALAQVIEFLAKFPPGVERTGVAMTIFGRAGKDFAAITDEMKGSLTDYTAELTRMGVILGKDDLTAAREFIREQEHLGKQWEVIKYKIEAAATPIVEEWLKNISEWLSKNQADIIAWGNKFVQTLSSIASGFLEFVGGIKSGWDQLNAALEPIDAVIRVAVIDPLNYLQIGGQELFGGGYKPKLEDPGPSEALKAFTKQRQQEQMDQLFLPEKKPAVPANPFAGGGKGGRKHKEETEAHKQTMRELEEEKNAVAELERVYREAADEIKHGYEERLTAFADYISAERAANDKRQDAIIVGINAEQARLDEAFNRKIINQKEYDKANDELTKQNSKAQEEQRKEVRRLDEEEYKHRLDLERQFRAEVEALANQKDQDLIASLTRQRDLHMQDAEWTIANDEQRIKRQLQIELQYNNEVQTIRLSMVARRKQILDDEIEEIAKHYAEVNKVTLAEAMTSKVVTDALLERKNKVTAIEYERSQIIQTTTDANVDAYRKEAKAAFDAQNAAAQGATRKRRTTDLDIPEGDAGGLLGGLQGGRLDELTKGVQSFADVASVAFGAVGAAVNGLAQGIGNLVQTWVLMGNTGGQTFRKLVATILASVAQQAAVLAVMSLAYAALATTAVGAILLGGTPAQFLQAALLFGGVALVAGLAGRAIAGNNFQQPTAAGASGAKSGASSSGAPTSPQAVEVGRRIYATTGGGGANTPAPSPINFQPQIHLHISGEAGAAFEYKVIKAIVSNHRLNGEVRTMIEQGVT